MADIKPEIKLDPSAPSGGLNDLEEYEDDIDLTFPDPTAQSWLTRVPEDLWKAWHEVYGNAPDDTVIKLGTLRVYHQPAEQTDPTKQKLQLHLNDVNDLKREGLGLGLDAAKWTGLGRKYDLSITSAEYNNSVVFSEKDLPGHKPSQVGRGRLQPGKPTGIPSRDQRYGNNNTKSFGRARSAIPKQTSLAARVQHEATATPVLDAAYEAHFANKWQAHMAPKDRTTFIAGLDHSVNTSSTNYLSTFNTFGLSAKPKTKKNKADKGKDKFVRMERGDLLVGLQNCFRKYRYWPMRALRNRLRQPEVWIKEVLEEIAYLVRSGDWALSWTLKPEWQSIIRDEDDVKEEAAAFKEESEDTGGTGDEDDGEDFEDVKMEDGL